LVPWKITLTFESPTQKANFNYAYKLEGAGVSQQLRCLEFMQALERGGDLQIENLETGLRFPPSRLNAIKETNVSGRYIKVIKELVNIQDRTLTPLNVPNGLISVEDADEISAISHMIEKGQHEIRFPALDTQYPASDARAIIDSLKENGFVRLIHRSDLYEEVEILGTKVNLGKCIVYGNANLVCPTMEELEEQLSSPKVSEIIEMKFKFADRNISTYFLKWLSSENLEKLKLETVLEIDDEESFNTWISSVPGDDKGTI
jgi:hypothetical protein